MPFSLPHRGDAARALALVALACLALGIAGTVDAVTHVERTEEERIFDVWQEGGEFRYEPLPAEGGEPLPMGRPGYLTQDAPVLRVLFEWALQDAAAARTTARAELVLHVQGAPDAARGPWEHVETLARTRPSEAQSANLTLSGRTDIPALAERLRFEGRALEGSTWRYVARVHFSTESETAPRNATSEYVLPLDYTPPLYALPPAEALVDARGHSQREVIPHEHRPGAAALLAQPLAPILLIAGAFGGVALLGALVGRPDP